jgi:hypothetical protein
MTNIEPQSVEVKTFGSPDEKRLDGVGELDLVVLAGITVARLVLEPGWRWSKDMKPNVDTESCEIWHLGYCLQGRQRYTMNDGAVREIGPGEVFSIPPGHDSEAVGINPTIMVDFGEMADFAKRYR